MIENQTVIAQNIDYGADENAIGSYFSRAGSIENIKIATDIQGNSKGTAFITYCSPEGAQRSIQLLNNTVFNGKKISVEFKKTDANLADKSDECDLSSKDKVDNQELLRLIKNIDSRLDSMEKARSALDRLNFNQLSMPGNGQSDEVNANPSLFSLNHPPPNSNDQDIPIKINDDEYSDDYDDLDDIQTGSNITDMTQDEAYQAKIFNETMKIIKNGSYRDSKGNFNDIKKKVAESNKNTMTIDKNLSYDKYMKFRFKNKYKWGKKEKSAIYSKIEITNESTLEAASRIKSFGIREVVILNFASPLNAGGGSKNNKIGQEQLLVRQSSLYSSLIQHKRMYKYNRSHRSPFYSNFMIYSPNVVVIRDDDYNLIYPFRVSVISAPAVNNSELLKSHPNGEKGRDVYKCMKDRSRRILQLAISMNNRAIVLGAYGCGVFGNHPKDISKIFKELLIDEFYGMLFTKIIFAIKGKPHQQNHNLDVFRNTFHFNQ